MQADHSYARDENVDTKERALRLAEKVSPGSYVTVGATSQNVAPSTGLGNWASSFLALPQHHLDR